MNITNNESEKMKIFRKQINKIMNLNMLKNFEKLPNIDTIISLYSSKKSYISPKQKHLINNKSKEIKRNISPNNQKQNNLLHNRNNNKEIPLINNNKENKNERKELKKYNYKKKIVINKQKLNKNRENNNLILGSLIDDNEGMFDSNSLEKINTNKLKNYVNNKINEKEKSKNLGNNIFDMGSISHISKNGSSSAKEKIGEEEIKNNNPFEKIVCDFIEEKDCQNLFQENKNNDENVNNENPINIPYKSKALNEILKTETSNTNINKEEILIKKDKEQNDDTYKKIITKFADDIMKESKSEVILVEKFVEDIFKESLNKHLNKNFIEENSQNADIILVKKFADEIFIESISKNFVKILFDEILKGFKERQEKSINTCININNSKKEKYINNNIEILKYKKISEEINNNENDDIYITNKNSVNNSESKPSFHTLEKKNNNLLKSQETKNIDSVYKRIATLPNVSKNFRFGFLKKNSIRREYQQKRYKTINSENYD